jgi:hypothetical protein
VLWRLNSPHRLKNVDIHIAQAEKKAFHMKSLQLRNLYISPQSNSMISIQNKGKEVVIHDGSD